MSTKKTNPITVKIESQLCSRVEDMCKKIEAHMQKVSLDPIKDKILMLAKRLQNLEDSFSHEVRDINEDLMNLVDKHWYDLNHVIQTQEEEADEPVA